MPAAKEGTRLQSSQPVVCIPGGRGLYVRNWERRTGAAVSRVNDFHSLNETSKHPVNRVYYSQGSCPAGHDIPESERRPGRADSDSAMSALTTSSMTFVIVTDPEPRRLGRTPETPHQR